MEIKISVQGLSLVGDLHVPDESRAIVIIAETESDRWWIQDNFMINRLAEEKIASLRVGLVNGKLYGDERDKEAVNKLTEEIIAVTKWCFENNHVSGLKMGYLGYGLNSAGLLSASSYWGPKISAVVSVYGRPDLAYDLLDLVESPTLLIVDGQNRVMVEQNKLAHVKLGCIKKMESVADGGDLILMGEKIASLTAGWFVKHFYTE